MNHSMKFRQTILAVCIYDKCFWTVTSTPSKLSVGVLVGYITLTLNEQTDIRLLSFRQEAGSSDPVSYIGNEVILFHFKQINCHLASN